MKYCRIFLYIFLSLIYLVVLSVKSSAAAKPTLEYMSAVFENVDPSKTPISDFGDGAPHFIENHTLVAKSMDGEPMECVKAKCYYDVIKFGDEAHPFSSLSISTKDLALAGVFQINYRASFYPFDNAVDVDPGVMVRFKFDNRVYEYTDVCKRASLTNGSSTFPSIFETQQKLPVSEQAEDVTLEFINTSGVEGYFMISYVTYYYYAQKELADPAIVLPMPLKMEWNANGVSFTDQPDLYSQSLAPEDFIVTLTPKFEIVPVPEDATDEHLEAVKGQDAYYHTDCSAAFDVDYSLNAMTFDVPCSGVYTLTVSTRPNLTGYKVRSVSADYTIYPSMDGMHVNWIPITDMKGQMLSFGNDRRNWTNAILGLDTYFCDMYYRLIGTPYENTDFGGYKPLPATDRSVIRKADVEGIPAGYQKYTSKGIDLTGGKALSMYFVKNGAVSPEKQLEYLLPDDTMTGVEMMELDIDSECLEYYTLQGVKINRCPMGKGVYVEKSSRGFRKVVF